MIETGAQVGHWVAERVNGAYWPERDSALGWQSNGELTAGVWYEGWNGATVICHIAIEAPLTRGFLREIFRYPFEHVGKIIAPVKSINLRSRHLVERMGFVRESIIADGYKDADMFLYTMRREACRFIGEKHERLTRTRAAI